MRGIIKDKGNENAQILVILGIVLATSVFLISSLASEIANVDFVVISETQSSLAREFSVIKESFGATLNYNIAETSSVDTKMINPLKGNITDIEDKFEQTRNEYFNVLLTHGFLFDAHLNGYEYSFKETGLYYVHTTLLLDDGNARVTENVTYSIRFIQY